LKQIYIVQNFACDFAAYLTKTAVIFHILLLGGDNRAHCNKLPRILKSYRPKGRRSQERPFKRRLEVWDGTGQPVAQLDDSLMITMIV